MDWLILRTFISECEVFDYNTYQWTNIAPLNKGRITFSLLIYQNYIYAVGGYTGSNERSRKVLNNNLYNNLKYY